MKLMVWKTILEIIFRNHKTPLCVGNDDGSSVGLGTTLLRQTQSELFGGFKKLVSSTYHKSSLLKS